jgi:nitrate reductase NapE component
VCPKGTTRNSDTIQSDNKNFSKPTWWPPSSVHQVGTFGYAIWWYALRPFKINTQ